MSVSWKIVGITAVLTAAAAAAITVGLSRRSRAMVKPRPIDLEGAVVLKDSDPKKESPIAGVSISVDAEDPDAPAETATSNFSGYFKLRLPPTIVYDESVTLRLRHPDHQPLDLEVDVSDQ